MDQQLVTYKKKIVSNKKATTNKWWQIFKSLLIGFALVALTVMTDGIGAAVAGSIGLADGIGGITSLAIDTAIQFGIQEGMDAITGNISLQNTLQNLAFSAFDIGRIGRGFKNQKLLKIAKELKLFDEAKITGRFRNLYELKSALAMKDITLVDGIKISLGKKITDTEIIETIGSIATSVFKRDLSTLTNAEIRDFLEIQRTIQRINPKLFEDMTEFKKNFDFEKHFGMDADEFVNLSTDDAISKILEKDFAESTLDKLFKMREQALFQQESMQVFKRYVRKWKSRIDKWNPKKWVSKILNKILEKPRAFIEGLEMKTRKFFSKLTKKEIGIITRYGLIPCRSDSMFIGFKFEPSSMSGEGYITLYKRDHINRNGTISKYNVVRAWTSKTKVEAFALTPHQNRFYLYESGWALGWGFSQKQFKLLKLISPRVSAILAKVKKIYTTVVEVYVVATAFQNMSSGNFLSKLKSTSINKILNSLRLSKFKGLFTDVATGDFDDFLYDFTKFGSTVISHAVIKHIRGLK